MTLVLLDKPEDSTELELKTEPERYGSGPGGSNRPPRRTALGYMGEDDDAGHNMRKWQRMQIKVLERGLQGYKIWLIATGDFAFLKTDLELKIGSVCDGLFQQWNSDGTATFILDTKKRAEQMIEPQSFSLKDLLPFKDSLPRYKPEFNAQASSVSDSEARFELANPTDTLPPPLSISEFAPLDLVQHKLQNYLDWFKVNAYTGIVKFKHERFNSYGAIVLLRGRCTGAIFTSEEQPVPLNTEQSLAKLYKAMDLLGADVVSYTLPEEIVLPISAAFLGHPIQNHKENSKQNFDYLIDCFEKLKSIAIMVITSKHNGTIFVYVYDGKMVGFLSLEHKCFFMDTQAVFEFVSNDNEVEFYSRILPNELALESFHFGFELKL